MSQSEAALVETVLYLKEAEHSKAEALKDLEVKNKEEKSLAELLNKEKGQS